jgi:hypothetical protein
MTCSSEARLGQWSTWWATTETHHGLLPRVSHYQLMSNVPSNDNSRGSPLSDPMDETSSSLSLRPPMDSSSNGFPYRRALSSTQSSKAKTLSKERITHGSKHKGCFTSFDDATTSVRDDPPWCLDPTGSAAGHVRRGLEWYHHHRSRRCCCCCCGKKQASRKAMVVVWGLLMLLLLLLMLLLELVYCG